MVTDLVQIRRLGEKKRDENFRFRQYLKTHDYPERRFRRIAGEIEEQIDCTVCGNCCRVATASLLPRDVARLARFLRIPEKAFLEQYTEKCPEEGVILKRPAEACIFLSGNECTVYEARPAACQNFPHLVRGAGPLSTRMWQMVDRAAYCPIVYNALEAYKALTGFRTG